MKKTILILVVSLLAAGCQAPAKRDTGAVIGGIAGGVLGNQVGGGKGRTAAIIVGTLAGAYAGGYIGQQMDENDRYKAQEALETAPTNSPVSWQNPDTQHQYTVTPVRTYETAQGPCREYTTEAIIAGKREVVRGEACRQPDGSWKVAG